MNHIFECGAGERVAGMKEPWYIKRFTWTGAKLNIVVRNSATDEEHIVALGPHQLAELGRAEKEAANVTS